MSHLHMCAQVVVYGMTVLVVSVHVCTYVVPGALWCMCSRIGYTYIVCVWADSGACVYV